MESLKRILIRRLDSFSLGRRLISLVSRLKRATFSNKKIQLLGQEMCSSAEWARHYDSVSFQPRSQLNSQFGFRTISQSKLANPKIAVITSIFKGEEFLENFLRTMESQSMASEAEFIFVAAGSRGAVLKRLTSWAQSRQNVTLLATNEAIRIYEAWNLAIQHSRAELITNANLDDVRAPYSLEHQVRFMSENNSLDVGYSDVFISLTPNLSWETIEAIGFRTKLPEFKIETLVCRGLNYPHNAPVWRSKLHVDIGMFSEKYESAGDTEFWLRCLLAKKQFAKSPRIHSAYYLNPDGISTRVTSRGPAEWSEILRNHGEILKHFSRR